MKGTYNQPYTPHLLADIYYVHIRVTGVGETEIEPTAMAWLPANFAEGEGDAHSTVCKRRTAVLQAVAYNVKLSRCNSGRGRTKVRPNDLTNISKLFQME